MCNTSSKKTEVGIITIIGENFGNRLQNYALQEVVKAQGCNVETINNRPINYGIFNTIKHKLKDQGIVCLIIETFYALLRRFNFIGKKQLINHKKEAFNQFNDKYINLTDYWISENNIPKNLDDRYDFFIAGSDQIWNTECRYGSSIDFLTFAQKHKRITFSVSFGTDVLNDKYNEIYKRYILEIPYLSIREKSGKKIIKELTGRESLLLSDPIILLDKETWLILSKPSNKPNNKYMLVCFLGIITKSYEIFIKDIAKKSKLDIVRLFDISQPKHYAADPCQYIDYINSASIICTDSFHASAFSILLNKPFIVFDRIDKFSNMSSRVETLLEKYNLQSRHFHNIIDREQIYDIDYTHVSKIIESERSKSIDYIKKVLNL